MALTYEKMAPHGEGEPEKRGSALVNFFLVIVSLGLCLLAIEVLFRMGSLGKLIPALESASGSGLKKGMELNQTGTVDASGQPVKINWTCLGEGLSKNYTPKQLKQRYQKSKNKKRILIIGDSYTKGHGLHSFDLAYPKILQRKLENQNVDLLTLSYCGYTAWEELNMLETLGRHFQPDLLVIGYVLNDILQKHPSRKRRMSSGEAMDLIREDLLQSNGLFKKVSAFRELGQPFQFLNFLADRYLKETVQWHYPRHLYFNHTDSWNKLTETYDQFSKYLKQRKIPGYLLLFPNLENSRDWDESYQVDVLEKIKAMAQDRGFNVIDLFPAYREYEPRGLRFQDDAHPNPLAQSIAARALHERLKQDGQIH
ncbi:MAG: hypothetical protein G3M70_04515 [Candidatus Nitronauta litoralis]|uniref:SGNH hydrolase-type esterase domain-containing protein n=1 Tax=Candidatus Nitronauta litoralis TaxID=2705533 RepID=A0A7T0FZ50_9BACT|nr:MAG: hypothetical protein G3M70_04515 [Candidatus Nitronauta litoralis]